MTVSFDPNAPAAEDSGIYGLPFTEDDAAVVLVPVPWEVTTSYGGGTSGGPAAILAASRQVDLYDLDVEKPYAPGIFMQDEAEEIARWNEEGRALAQKIIEVGGVVETDELRAALARVNELGAKLNARVEAETERLVAKGKIVGIVGGDHAVPLGAIEALARRHPGLGILHFDAHSDTRRAYEGFTFSHASIMYNVLSRAAGVGKLVQVGIRDVCEEEMDYVASQGERARVFFDRDLARRKIGGETFATITREIVDALPREVWVSFDVDGLDPRYCPHTGTPVPGGLDFHEAVYVIGEVARSGRTIVGFDLNEVAPGPDGDEWDANVGARLLYKLIGLTLASQGKAKLR
ncbi:arginase family protein [Polyangium sp. 6x1]|uniref:arginase family protein n=1 Tax=Polyangium sp. 6x1 TaxID=3042689 RepID=UPI0024827CC5|nr:arginase family protein [Polyangium sp. 6x1]MDI1447188.1 arginase family protein [Polyangium sp. 6x1]